MGPWPPLVGAWGGVRGEAGQRAVAARRWWAQGSLQEVPKCLGLPGPVKCGHCLSVGPKAYRGEERVAAGLCGCL